MSVQRGWPNAGHFYSNVFKPGQIFMNFIVDSTNGNGLGVRSVKSNGFVNNVFMHTSATPGVGKDGITNPNPAVGYCLIQMKNAYNVYLGGFSGFVSPSTGSTIVVTSAGAHLTPGVPYIIASVGTTTAAQWATLGLPPGLTPTVGQSFIALVSGVGTGTGTVIAAGTSGLISAEVIGDPNQSIQNSSIASNGGAWTLLQLLGPTSSSVTTLIPTAPTAGTVIGLSFFYDQSSSTVDGL
jgi:hypothetical protein